MFKKKGCLRSTEHPFLVMRKKARIFVTDTGRNIDVTTGAERRLFNFFFSSVLYKGKSLEGLEHRKIWRFEERGERIK